MMKAILLALAFLAGASKANAQDLFERAKAKEQSDSPVKLTEYRGRDRLDLRATASLPQLVPDSGSARLGIDATIESDFACGKFDVRSTIKNLLGKEAREDFLKGLIGSLESQMTYNALVLACEASPTACQAFQHFRVNANAMLGVHYDRCQAIESAVHDGLQGVRAQAVKDCVEEKRKSGKSMSEALDACKNSETLRSFDGSQVHEIDVLGEIKKTFGMNDVDFRKLETLLSPLRIGASGAKGEVRADGALRRFDTLNAEYQAAWTRTLKTASDTKQEPTSEELGKLSPAGQPGVLPAELRELAILPEPQRRILVRTIASQAALLQLTTEVQEVERKLAALRKSPQLDQVRARLLEHESDDLRLQVRQIDELVRRQGEYSRELLKATDFATRFQDRAATETLQSSGDSVRDDRLFREVAPKFGTVRGCPVGECSKTKSAGGSSK